MLSQGKEWEKKAEYNRAIDMYLKITPDMTTDHELVEDAMVKVRGACHGVLPSSALLIPIAGGLCRCQCIMGLFKNEDSGDRGVFNRVCKVIWDCIGFLHQVI